jgi:hypothetical protein
MAATKLRGHRKLDVIRDLAMAAASMTELGEKYGVTIAAISHFNQDFAAEIEAVRNALLSDAGEEAAGLWIADKVKRIAEYQQDVDDINEILADRLDDRLVKVKHQALRAVAEELGALPNKAPASQQTEDKVLISYTITAPKDLD